MARSRGQKWWPEVVRTQTPGTESQDGRPGKFSRAPRESPAHRESVSFIGRLVSETCMAPCMALVCSWIKSITPQMINQPRRSFSGVGGCSCLTRRPGSRATMRTGRSAPPKRHPGSALLGTVEEGTHHANADLRRHREPARSPPRPHPHTQTFAHPPLKPPPTKPRIRGADRTVRIAPP